MIGFKTIDNYTFDECIAFLNENGNTDPSWIEVNSRYQRLLTNLQRYDDSAFSACASLEDFKNYIDKFSSINGASKYQPRHIDEASAFLGAQRPSKLSKLQRLNNYLNAYFEAHNIFAYLVLTVLSIFSAWSVISIVIFCIIQELVLPDIPILVALFLWSVGTLASMWQIWSFEKLGISMLLIVSIISFIPLIFVNYWYFVESSSLSVFTTILLWGTLHIKKHGIPAWLRYIDEPLWLTKLRKTIVAVWLCFVVFFPPIVGLCSGFRSEIYQNGMDCIDNYLYSEVSE